MFRAIQFVMAAVALFGMSAVAQADHIPMLVNNTTGGTIIFDATFENETVGNTPTTPEGAGTWSVTEYGSGGMVRVADLTSEGIPAYEGTQFVKMTKDKPSPPGKLTGSGFAGTSGAGNEIMMTFGFHLGASPYPDYEQLSLFLRESGASKDLGQVSLFSDGRVGVVKSDGSDWQFLTQTSTPGQWNTLVIKQTNGTNQWSLSTNGSAFETRTCQYNTGNWDGFRFEWSNWGENFTSTGYIDAVVPEPSTFVLLATGLIGLLCYAWRKRK